MQRIFVGVTIKKIYYGTSVLFKTYHCSKTMPNDDKITVQHVVDWSDHSNKYTKTQRDTTKFTSVTVTE